MPLIPKGPFYIAVFSSLSEVNNLWILSTVKEGVPESVDSLGIKKIIQHRNALAYDGNISHLCRPGPPPAEEVVEEGVGNGIEGKEGIGVGDILRNYTTCSTVLLRSSAPQLDQRQPDFRIEFKRNDSAEKSALQ